MINLKSLNVSGFRAFTKEEEFKFENPATFIFGANHYGKSSTLNAIEWCLFGNDCVGTDTGIRERIDFEIPNRYMKPISVSVELVLEDTDSNETYNILREWISAKRNELTVKFPDGNTVSGVDAEDKLVQLTKLTFRDFLTTVYQHQEAIRAVLTQKPSERNEAIDRLLGLSDYRNLLTGIDGAGLQTVQRDMGNYFDNFTKRISDALAIRERDLEDKRKDTLQKDINKDQLNEKGALKIAKEVKSRLEVFSKEIGIKLEDLNVPENSEGLDEFNENARDVITEFRAKMPGVEKQKKLFDQRTEITSLKTTYEQDKETYDEANKESKQFIKKNGDEKAIKKKQKHTEKKLKGKKKELSEADAKAAAVNDSIKFLKLESIDKDVCPVCGKKTENLLGHLEQEWKKKYEKNVGKLQEEIEALENQVEAIEDLLVESESLNKKFGSAKKDLEETNKKIGEVLKKEISDKDDPVVLIQKELEKVDKELASLEKAVKSKQKILNDIASTTNNIDIIDGILKLEEKKKVVEKLQQSKEYKDMQEQNFKMAVLVEDVAKIKEAITKASHKEAKQKVTAAGNVIDDFFRRIANNPAVSKLHFSVDVDRRTAKNSYKFRDQNGKDLYPILSQGDLNALALSIFLGMNYAAGKDNPIGFIMMDDPSQSLGSDHKEKLVEVLDEVLNERNVIISTMDNELQDMLNNNITKAKTRYVFTDWTTKNGPEISEA